MPGPAILALDWSKRCTGIAYGRPGEMPRLSKKSFAQWEGADIGDCSCGVIQWLDEIWRACPPDLIVIEAALQPRFSRDMTSTHLALGADFLIKGLAKIRKVPCRDVKVVDWRRYFLGKSRPDEDPKALARAVCTGMGLATSTHDEAEAAGLWFYACATFTKHQNDEILPLLAKARMKAAA